VSAADSFGELSKRGQFHTTEMANMSNKSGENKVKMFFFNSLQVGTKSGNIKDGQVDPKQSKNKFAFSFL
jgi:hypothetical protein